MTKAPAPPRDRLTPGEALWFEQEGVDLDDPRIAPVRRQHGGGQVIDFDVEGGDGPVRVQFDPAGDGLPWVVASGPESLVGVRFEAVAEAVEVALAGRLPTCQLGDTPTDDM